MIKIVNTLIPFEGFMAMNMWPFLFIRKECENKITEEDMNHEEIHSCQQIEILLPSLILSLVFMCMGYWMLSILIIPLFFWWYLIEWGVKSIIYNDSKKAYKEIGFEKEAYTNEKNLSYISRRKHFVWLSYI